MHELTENHCPDSSDALLQIDDAVRVVLTNSKFNGAVPNSFKYREWPRVSGSVDIAKYMAKGDNRVVLVHVDDKCTQSTLW
jgi:hypothetical protein